MDFKACFDAVRSLCPTGCCSVRLDVTRFTDLTVQIEWEAYLAPDGRVLADFVKASTADGLVEAVRKYMAGEPEPEATDLSTVGEAPDPTLVS